MFHHRDRRSTTPAPGAVAGGAQARVPATTAPVETIPLRLPITYQVPFGDTAETPFAIADNDTHMCPFDGAASIFVLYHARGARGPGLYVWNVTMNRWDRVATLESLPTGEWVGVRDADGWRRYGRCVNRVGLIDSC